MVKKWFIVVIIISYSKACIIVFMMDDTSNPIQFVDEKVCFYISKSSNLRILHADHEKSMVGSFHLGQ